MTKKLSIRPVTFVGHSPSGEYCIIWFDSTKLSGRGPITLNKAIYHHVEEAQYPDERVVPWYDDDEDK